MISRHNFRRNNKGIGTVFGMVFFILIVMIVIASLIVILNQNTGLQQTTTQANQLDLNRYTELQTVSILNPAEAPGTNTVYVECNIADNGPLSAQLDRIWIKDTTTNQTVNAPLSPALVLNSGSTTPYFNAIGFQKVNSSSTDLFNFWFITARGNAISATPSPNQLNKGSNGIVSNSTAGSPPGSTTMQLSLTTKSPNNLIYLAVIFDDDGTVTPTSTPNLTWTERGESATTSTQGGDSFLETWYAIMPTSGTISISFTQTNGEGDYYWAAMAFAVSGVKLSSPFDGNCKMTIGNTNNAGHYSGTQPSLSISTTNAHDLVIGALAIDWRTPSITPGTGFTQVLGAQNSGGATQTTETTAPRSIWIESMITNTTATNMSVNATFTQLDPWAFAADAVQLITPSTNTLTLSPNSGPVGQTFTVSGSGFAANSPLLATFAGSIVPFSFTTTASGNIPAGATITVPAGSTSGNKQVEIVDSKFNYANSTFTVTTASITVSPANGAAGTSVTVTGSYFVSSSTITLNYNGNPLATTPSIVTTNAAGGFSATFVAAGAAGVQTVSATDGVNSANTVFTITPSITITPASSPKGSQVAISGSGFAANSAVTLTFAGQPLLTSPGTIGTDVTGSFFGATFIVPTAYTGVQTVVATDTNSNSGSFSFTVSAATISLSPSSGTVGTTVTIAGGNFVASSSITIDFDGAAIATTQANSLGQIPSGVTYQIPVTTAGAHSFTAFDTSLNSGFATFTVIPSITITSPTSASGVVGSSVTISGLGFAANSGLTATLGGTSVILSGTTSTTAQGSFAAATFIVPSSTAGSNTIIFSDSAIPTQNTASTTFTLLPSISIAPNNGNVGATITLSGSGFAANSQITVKYGTNTVTTIPPTVTTSASGAIPSGVTFTVPASTAGVNTVTATDQSSNTGSAQFTVIQAITLSPTSGNVGSTVTVSGTGFATSSIVTVSYNGVAQTYPTSNNVGSFAAVFAVPSSVHGVYTVQASDSSGNTAFASFTVTSGITLSPTSGVVGTTVTVSGSSFAASSTITIKFAGVTQITIPGTVTTSSSGSFSGVTFTVPA